MPLGRIGATFRDAIVGTLGGVGDVVGTTIEVTRANSVKALKGVSEIGTETTSILMEGVSGVVQGAIQVGSDVGSSAKGAVIGTILGVGEIATVTVGTLSDTVRAAIQGTSEVGGDVAEAGRGAAEGAISTTKELGLSLEDAGSRDCPRRHRRSSRRGQRSRHDSQVNRQRHGSGSPRSGLRRIVRRK